MTFYGLTLRVQLDRIATEATAMALAKQWGNSGGRMLATEANALAKATGQRKILIEAAREFAATMVARLKVRDIRPSQYANAEAKAARSAQKASQSGDLKTAAAEKRNELVNHYATRAAYDAQAEVRATGIDSAISVFELSLLVTHSMKSQAAC